jgi:hypothetical protein
VPVARRYRIRIDREQKVVEQPVVTGRFILGLVGAATAILPPHGGHRGTVDSPSVS